MNDLSSDISLRHSGSAGKRSELVKLAAERCYCAAHGHFFFFIRVAKRGFEDPAGRQ